MRWHEFKISRTRRYASRLFYRSVVFCLFFQLGVFPAFVYSLPQGGKIVAGSGDINLPSASQMVINQASNKLIANWNSFNIAAPESVQFNQPGAGAIAFNRVTGQDPSIIRGRLSANGQVFLSNGAGILFGQGSRVDVGGLFATTLGMSDQDFLNGNYRWTQNPGLPPASVTNQGSISAAYVGLLAPAVANQGNITARLGSVALASGTEATMDFVGDGLINIALSGKTAGEVRDLSGNVIRDRVLNSGAIAADGGVVRLSAKDAGDAIRNVVNNTGIIQARSVVTKNGEVHLLGDDTGIVNISGTVDVSGANAGEKGGMVHALGDKIAVTAANIMASGHSGGGTVLIGGDFQGGGGFKTASSSYIGRNALIQADADYFGHGGKVIIWSDDTTRFGGNISARGGAHSGDGGLVEVSGKKYLDFMGNVNTLAPNGRAGSLLLDPDTITISVGTGAQDGLLSSGTVSFTSGSGSATIGKTTLEAIGATTNITLQANTSIVIDDLTSSGNDGILELKQTSGNSVTFTATSGSIYFNNFNNMIRTQGGSIEFSAGSGLSVGKLQSNGGAITLSAKSGVSVDNDIITRGGSFTVSADSDSDGSGTYTQIHPAIVATMGGNASITAANFTFLSGYSGNSAPLSVPVSISTIGGSTPQSSFNLDGAGGSITLTPTNNASIGIGSNLTSSSTISLSNAHMQSLRSGTGTLTIGSTSQTGNITVGSVDFFNSPTHLKTGGGITFQAGEQISFRKNFAATAGGDITVGAGTTIGAHVSGVGATVTIIADNDQTDGGGFTSNSGSIIAARGGDISITGNTITMNGTTSFPAGGGSLTQTTRSTTSSSTSSSSTTTSSTSTSTSTSSTTSASSTTTTASTTAATLAELKSTATTTGQNYQQATQSSYVVSFAKNASNC